MNCARTEGVDDSRTPGRHVFKGGIADITAVILAGGLGTRLRSVVPDYPKVLAPINGRPFLTYVLDQLESFGFRKVIFCTGFAADKVEAAFGYKYGNISIGYSNETTPLGTGGAVHKARELISSDVFFLLNGDSFVAADFTEYWRWFESQRIQASLLLAEVPDRKRFGSVEFESCDKISAFIEKGAESGPGWINAGVYILDKEVIGSFLPDQAFSLEKDLFPGLIENGLYGFRAKAAFIDIGTPESYRRAADFFATCRQVGRRK